MDRKHFQCLSEKRKDDVKIEMKKQTVSNQQIEFRIARGNVRQGPDSPENSRMLRFHPRKWEGKHLFLLTSPLIRDVRNRNFNLPAEEGTIP